MKGKNRLAHSFLFIRLMRAGSGAKLRSFVARRRFRETAVVAGLRARAPSPERGAMIAPFSPLVLETRLPRRGRPPFACTRRDARGPRSQPNAPILEIGALPWRRLAPRHPVRCPQRPRRERVLLMSRQSVARLHWNSGESRAPAHNLHFSIRVPIAALRRRTPSNGG